jgi:hypothetical protein
LADSTEKAKKEEKEEEVKEVSWLVRSETSVK